MTSQQLEGVLARFNHSLCSDSDEDYKLAQEKLLLEVQEAFGDKFALVQTLLTRLSCEVLESLT